jgi:hypothetical protein
MIETEKGAIKNLSLLLQAAYLQVKHTDLLGHPVIPPVLLTKKNSQKKAQENECAAQEEKNEIARQFKTEKTGQFEQQLREHRKENPQEREKKPGKGVFEGQLLSPHKLQHEQQNESAQRTHQ